MSVACGCGMQRRRTIPSSEGLDSARNPGRNPGSIPVGCIQRIVDGFVNLLCRAAAFSSHKTLQKHCEGLVTSQPNARGGCSMFRVVSCVLSVRGHEVKSPCYFGLGWKGSSAKASCVAGVTFDEGSQNDASAQNPALPAFQLDESVRVRQSDVSPSWLHVKLHHGDAFHVLPT